MGETQARRRLRWFQVGVRAAQAVLPGHDGGSYVCPLCLRGFPRQAVGERVLTDEHVPPRSVGGRALVLTCSECNSTGSRFDAELARQRDLLGLASGQSTKPLRAVFSVAGHRQRAEVVIEHGVLKIFGVPRQNHPEVTKAIIETMNRITETGTAEGLQFGIDVRQFADLRMTWLGWMRAAYLAAFAVLGYSYIARPVFDELRAQWHSPEKQAFVTPTVLQNPRLDPLERRILFPEQPAELEGSLLVSMGWYIVLLPVDDDAGYFQRMHELIMSGSLSQPGEISGKEVPEWPKAPQHHVDLGRLR